MCAGDLCRPLKGTRGWLVLFPGTSVPGSGLFRPFMGLDCGGLLCFRHGTKLRHAGSVGRLSHGNGLRKATPALTFNLAPVYALSRRFRQGADSRVSAPWPAIPGSFGLHASEGQCNYCPVSHPTPVTNKASTAIRPLRDFLWVPTVLSRGVVPHAPRVRFCSRHQKGPMLKNRPKRSNFMEFYKIYREDTPFELVPSGTEFGISAREGG
jgi:hypothetical protein